MKRRGKIPKAYAERVTSMSSEEAAALRQMLFPLNVGTVYPLPIPVYEVGQTFPGEYRGEPTTITIIEAEVFPECRIWEQTRYRLALPDGTESPWITEITLCRKYPPRRYGPPPPPDPCGAL